MNTYLLGLISKWATTITIAVSGLFDSGSLLLQENIVVNNTNKTKNTVTTVTKLNYDTKTIYNKKLPKDTKNTKQQGIEGKAYKDNNGKVIEIVQQPKEEIIEIGTGEKASYVGKMTGYGADCEGCSGNVSCISWNLTTKGTTYNDNEYGKLRILAAALDKFPCGTIIEVKHSNLGTFNAIVLDTGGAMRSAWRNGTVLMDLAFTSESSNDIHQSTSSNVEYNVKRWGW